MNVFAACCVKQNTIKRSDFNGHRFLKVFCKEPSISLQIPYMLTRQTQKHPPSMYMKCTQPIKMEAKFAQIWRKPPSFLFDRVNIHSLVYGK